MIPNSVRLPEPLDVLTPEEVAVLEQQMQSVCFPVGTCLFKVGAVGDSCYLIDHGVVRIELDRTDASGNEIDSDDVLGYVESGSILGELSLLDGLPRSASAYAQAAVQARMLSGQAIRSLWQTHPTVASAIYAALGRNAALKLRQTNQRLAQVVFQEAPDPEVDAMVARASLAQEAIQAWSEARIDALLRDMAHAIAERAEELAFATVEETGLGDVESKTVKNRVASLVVYRSLVGRPAHGPLGRQSAGQITEIASPVGVVFGMIPVTNPVATFSFKALIAVKGRNAIIVSPHRGAMHVCVRVGALLQAVLARHGAPADVIQCVGSRTSRKKTEQFMTHEKVALILATGGRSMVRAAYSSGKPAIGVGPGNTPTLICADVDPRRVARDVVRSKTFDNGLLCGAEHNLVVVRAIRDRMISALEQHGAAVLSERETSRFCAALINTATGQFIPEIIGQSAAVIAGRLALRRPYPVRLLVVPTADVSPSNPLAREKMAPILSLFTVEDVDDGISLCRTLLTLDGMGHTAAIHTKDIAVANRFGVAMPASRILVNSPAAQGIAGITTGLMPSFTLGCGTFGGTSTTDNVTYQHLLNIKRQANYAPQWLAGLEALTAFDTHAPLALRLFRAGKQRGKAWIEVRRRGQRSETTNG